MQLAVYWLELKELEKHEKVIDIFPLAIFVVLLIVLFSFLSEKDDQLETALVDSDFPDFSLSALSNDNKTLPKEIFLSFLP